ncbi:MAG: choice-of-anchor L domain-containing protein [Patiriisocius sp.]|uniref:choice-of-anchor L domain-containing protein n=1 Tax=Patiriisocius sp. TaxID=2822396 RepID=UPI003EF8AAC2
MKSFSTFILLLLSTSVMWSQTIIVNDPADPQSAFTAEELISEVLVSGNSCVDITLTDLFDNPNGATNNAEKSWGYFKNNNTSFPFQEGIILSTGFATSAQGPNDNGGTSDGDQFSWLGDSDLTTILNNEYGDNEDTFNATVFEFTFSSSLSEVEFEFIFASEEYEDQWECTQDFRDGFAFLVSGPGIPNDSGAPFGGTNIASVTGSNNVPVTTASIHADYFTCGFENPGVNFFPEFYVSNEDANNTNEIQFDGLTSTLTTATVSIVPNEIYTIKMVIADRGDGGFDSAVFLNAGSFNIGNVDLGDDITLGDPEAVCEGDVITLDAGNNPNGDYQWFKDNVLIPGETNSTLDVSETGLYRVDLTFPQSPDCLISDEKLVEFFSNPEFELGPDQLVCENNFLVLDATVTNPSELDNVSYKWFKDSVELVGETNATLTVSENGVYTAEVTGNNCVTTDEISIEIVVFNVNIGDVIALCGEESFTIVPEITGSANIPSATYLWSTGETTPTITVTQDGIYTLDVTIDNCTISDSVEIIFRSFAQVDLGPTVSKCASEISILTANVPDGDSTVYEYQWFKDGGLLAGENNSTIEVIEEGIYAVELNDNGCISSSSVSVTFYENQNCIISQGISPNGDGMNDNLDLEFLNDKSTITNFSVFNRLGRLVYQKPQYTNEWRGQSDDENILPVGNYFYVIELQAEESITGWVYLNK